MLLFRRFLLRVVFHKDARCLLFMQNSPSGELKNLDDIPDLCPRFRSGEYHAGHCGRSFELFLGHAGLPNRWPGNPIDR